MTKGAMKVQMTHIPYKGGAPMSTDLIAGTIPIAFDVITAFVPLMKSGQIKGLAVTSKARSPLAPDVPTVTELGYPTLVAENYFGVSGPAGLPKEVSDKLYAALEKIVADPATVKRFEELGITPVKATPVEFVDMVTRQANDWQPLIKAMDLK
jgi:tripartite-type tricarboxylate transporter receptor subunit TctC